LDFHLHPISKLVYRLRPNLKSDFRPHQDSAGPYLQLLCLLPGHRLELEPGHQPVLRLYQVPGPRLELELGHLPALRLHQVPGPRLELEPGHLPVR
jgi:hypothetical protein